MAYTGDVKSVTDLLSTVTEGFKEFFTNLEGTLGKLAGIPNILHGAEDNLKRVTSASDDSKLSLDKMNGSAQDIINSMVNFGGVTVDTFKAMFSGSQQNLDALGQLNTGVSTVISTFGLMALGTNNAFSALNESSKTSISNLSGFNTAFNSIFDLATLGKRIEFPFADQIKEFIPIATSSVDAVNNLETSLLAIHAQAGDLTKVMGDLDGAFIRTDDSQSNLTALTNQYLDMIKKTTESTGASVTQVINYTKEIIKIPGLYDSIINTDLNKNLSFTEAAMKLTRGTTQDFGITLDITKQQMLNFAQSGEKPLELISRMYSVSQNLNTPFTLVQEQIRGVSEQFKFLGDNTQGALNIFQSLGEGLQKSKLGPAAMAEIVKDVTNSIQQLDIAQKSFLSAQSGGATGLQGGYQIDQLLSEGKIDEVYKKIEGSLRQEFGGKITTLKEGANDAGAAQQLTKEVAFLTQGPFGQVVKSSQEAYKLLEAFQTGTTTPKTQTEAQLNTGLDKSINAGTEIAKAQYTELQKIANNTALFQLYSSKNVGETTREITKTELAEPKAATTFSQAVQDAPTASKAIYNAGLDVSKSLQDTYGKVANSSFFQDLNGKNVNAPNPPEAVNATPVETNATRPTQNANIPQLNQSDLYAEQARNNILKQRQSQEKETVQVGHNEQVLIVKVQTPGIDGKTEERIIAKARAQSIKDWQIAEQNAATVGH